MIGQLLFLLKMVPFQGRTIKLCGCRSLNSHFYSPRRPRWLAELQPCFCGTILCIILRLGHPQVTKPKGGWGIYSLKEKTHNEGKNIFIKKLGKLIIWHGTHLTLKISDTKYPITLKRFEVNDISSTCQDVPYQTYIFCGVREDQDTLPIAFNPCLRYILSFKC